MADLTSIANRITDNQVAPNKPITTSLLQTFGSDINYLLDFLGIANGSTGTSGTLNDLLTAVELCNTHTPDLLFTVENGVPAGSNTVATFNYIPFIDQVIFFRHLNGGSDDPADAGYSSTNAGSNIQMVGQFNDTALLCFDALDANGIGSGGDGDNPGRFNEYDFPFVARPATAKNYYSSYLEPYTSDSAWKRFFTLDARDSFTTFRLDFFIIYPPGPGFGTNKYEVFRSYKLNIGSLLNGL